ncbi:hypothetical protein [Sphingopyxis solisilvae]|uniref:hypothetical protein n=1 Tax=Sphingopyxis solisilvae TaxID=1886788 RepID=UPI001892C585|nr:hypothetical protein [Sphingopyxis solisilvae]
MDAGSTDTLILPVPPEPFALIVGGAMQGRSVDMLEQALRRMGLQPERVEDCTPGAIEPRFRLRFGTTIVLAGPAEGAVLDAADPDQPSTSLLAASLPSHWRQDGHCWTFVPEHDSALATATGQPSQLRDLFKMMVLLIDLFDASHLFWSPARLWSDAAQFRASIAEMLASGMPPVLHLVAFRRRDDAAGASMGTRGLALFAGQELEARIPVGWTVAEMVRRLSRLALDMMLNGPVQHERKMRGLESGEWIDLSPSSIVEGQRSTVIVEFGRDR